jgi:hypothetical protein
VKAKPMLVFSVVLLCVGGLAGLFLLMRASFARQEQDWQAEQDQAVADRQRLADDQVLARRLHERAEQIRTARSKVAQAALRGAAPDADAACPQATPTLLLTPPEPAPTLDGVSQVPEQQRRELRWAVAQQQDLPPSPVPLVPVSDKGVGIPMGLAERMEHVAERLGPATYAAAARAEAEALLAAPARELFFVITSYVRPHVEPGAAVNDAPIGFEGGAVAGRAVLADLDTGAVLCAADVSARSSEDIDFHYQVERYGSVEVPAVGSPSIHAEMAVQADLWKQLGTAVARAPLRGLAARGGKRTRAGRRAPAGLQTRP